MQVINGNKGKEKRLSAKIYYGILITGFILVIFMVNQAMHFIQNKDGYSEDGSAKTGIVLSNLTPIQSETLAKVGKVWGFLKYYHPAVATGTTNWDRELLKEVPILLKENTQDGVNDKLFQWVDGLGGKTGEPTSKKLPDYLNWLQDENLLGKKLSEKLTAYAQSGAPTSNAYYALDNNFPIFANEKKYDSMGYDDDGYKLLSLFRYWNAIEYLYPYRNLIDDPWDNVLKKEIPLFVAAKTEIDYKLACFDLSGEIQDSHALVDEGIKDTTLQAYFGKKIAPIVVESIEKQVVVTRKLSNLSSSSNLAVGDVVTAVNGVPIEEALKAKRRGHPVIRPGVEQIYVLHLLLRTNDDSIKLDLLRGDQKISVNVPTSSNLDSVSQPETSDSSKLITSKIGYIRPAMLTTQTGDTKELEGIMDKFKNTDGIIIDLREYPKDYIPFKLGNMLIDHKVPFGKVSYVDSKMPGKYLFDNPLTLVGNEKTTYKGKVEILMNERSVSKGEYTILALAATPHAEKVGSSTIGTIGGYTELPLPGGVTTTFTGNGVSYPDGKAIQRVGIQPDVEVHPTIEGIRSGKDEVLEKAMERIKS